MTQPTLFADRPSIQERFERFLEECPDVLPEFVRIARELKARGHKRYSSDGILHILRWNRLTSRSPSEPFALSDHYTSRLARRAMETTPDLAGFFETRKIRKP